jgi:hypothetical protein
MAKTSGYNPASPNPTRTRNMPPQKKQSTRRLPLASSRRKPPPEEPQDPKDDESMPTMPTLRRSELLTLDLRRSTRIRTPAQSPPKVLTIPGELHEDISVDPFHPLDYTNHERSPADLRILAQAAAAALAINHCDDLSISSSQSERTVGE